MYHIGNTVTPSNGAIGFSSVTLDISTIERIISKNDIINGTKITPTNALFKAVSFDVTATNHEITIQEIKDGATIVAPGKELFKQISFDPEVTNLITPEDTTATSDQIVFGATAVLDGVLTTGTMAPIAKAYNNNQFLVSCRNSVEAPRLCVDAYLNQIHTLTANTDFTDNIYLEYWPFE